MLLWSTMYIYINKTPLGWVEHSSSPKGHQDIKILQTSFIDHISIYSSMKHLVWEPHTCISKMMTRYKVTYLRSEICTVLVCVVKMFSQCIVRVITTHSLYIYAYMLSLKAIYVKPEIFPRAFNHYVSNSIGWRPYVQYSDDVMHLTGFLM